MLVEKGLNVDGARGGHDAIPCHVMLKLKEFTLRQRGTVWPARNRFLWFFRAKASKHISVALGHVWTAPWQEPSDVAATLVGCGHVSGLVMRQVWPLALMLCADRIPIEHLHLEVR